MPSLDYTHPREYGPGSRSWYVHFVLLELFSNFDIAVPVETVVVSFASMIWCSADAASVSRRPRLDLTM